jgi:hypothetical protein
LRFIAENIGEVLGRVGWSSPGIAPATKYYHPKSDPRGPRAPSSSATGSAAANERLFQHLPRMDQGHGRRCHNDQPILEGRLRRSPRPVVPRTRYQLGPEQDGRLLDVIVTGVRSAATKDCPFTTRKAFEWRGQVFADTTDNLPRKAAMQSRRMDRQLIPRETFADSEDTDPRRSHSGFFTLMYTRSRFLLLKPFQ